MTKDYSTSLRFGESQRVLMDDIGVGVTRVFALGIATLKMYIRASPYYTCNYISRTGEHAALPAVGSRSLEPPAAQGACCPACPMRAAFGARAAAATMNEADEWSGSVTYLI